MQGKQVRARKDNSPRTDNMGSAQTLLASSSSHEKALDTCVGQKAHPASSPLLAVLFEAVRRGWKSVAGVEAEVLQVQVLLLWVQAG